jgi:hypothetical protein
MRSAGLRMPTASRPKQAKRHSQKARSRITFCQNPSSQATSGFFAHAKPATRISRKTHDLTTQNSRPLTTRESQTVKSKNASSPSSQGSKHPTLLIEIA